MNLTCLTVELVEKLHTAFKKEKPVASFVEQLQAATLPGLVEYGCLRFAFPNQFPPVPRTVADSRLGKGLSDVRSELGIRQDGPQRGPVKSLQPSPVEFYVLENEADADSTEWNNFCHRFELGAKRSGFSDKTAINLQFALHEMASNAVIHSDATTAALIGYEIRSGNALFSVVDVGIGVLASLKTSEAYQNLSRPVDAIQQAMRPGVSRLGRGGLGFAQVFKAVTNDWGELRFRSGNGCIEMDGTGLDHSFDDVKRSYPPALPGFQVSMCCRTESPASNETVF